jgi:protein-S-isoprenylcysteine O-methyltransferase Ste14
MIIFAFQSQYQSALTDLPEQVILAVFGALLVPVALILCMAAEPLFGYVPGASSRCLWHRHGFILA